MPLSPKYTSKKNDPSLKAYQDSLYAYNAGKAELDKYVNSKANSKYTDKLGNNFRYNSDITVTTKKYGNIGDNVQDVNIYDTNPKLNTRLRPINSKEVTVTNDKTYYGNVGVTLPWEDKLVNKYSIDQYKKPNQPVIYRPETKIEKAFVSVKPKLDTKSTVKEFLPLKKQTLTAPTTPNTALDTTLVITTPRFKYVQKGKRLVKEEINSIKTN